jgi:hypothetical protein
MKLPKYHSRTYNTQQKDSLTRSELIWVSLMLSKLNKPELAKMTGQTSRVFGIIRV